jgi:hypothetical protein
VEFKQQVAKLVGPPAATYQPPPTKKKAAPLLKLARLKRRLADSGVDSGLILQKLQLQGTSSPRSISLAHTNSDGETLLHVTAAQPKCEGVVSWLLHEGADLMLKTSAGKNALHLAAGRGLRSTCEAFFSYVKNVDAFVTVQQLGWALTASSGVGDPPTNALTLAITQSGHSETIRYLAHELGVSSLSTAEVSRHLAPVYRHLAENDDVDLCRVLLFSGMPIQQSQFQFSNNQDFKIFPVITKFSLSRDIALGERPMERGDALGDVYFDYEVRD